MSVNINQLEMPKASAHAAEALSILSAESPDLKKLESSIMQDPVLATTLIRYANSPINRRATTVTNVPTALRLLGLKSVRSAVVTASIRSILDSDNEVAETILAHMLDISMLCKLIALRTAKTSADDVEFLGLVHDVGMLILAVNFKHEYETILQEAVLHQLKLDELERRDFKVSHNMVSARAAENYRLPNVHVKILQDFHSREIIKKIENEQQRDTCILALAHHLRIAAMKEINSTKSVIEESVPETVEELCVLLEINDNEFDRLKLDCSSLLEDKINLHGAA